MADNTGTALLAGYVLAVVLIGNHSAKAGIAAAIIGFFALLIYSVCVVSGRKSECERHRRE